MKEPKVLKLIENTLRNYIDVYGSISEDQARKVFSALTGELPAFASETAMLCNHFENTIIKKYAKQETNSKEARKS